MLDFTQSHISLAAAALAFGNPEPGLYAWLLPVPVSAKSSGRVGMPAVVQLSCGFRNMVASSRVAEQLGLQNFPIDVHDPRPTPGGWVKIEPLLLSFRYLRGRPLDGLPAYPRAVCNSVLGRPLWQGECKPLARMLPRAAAKSLKVQKETYFLIVIAKVRDMKLDARKIVTLGNEVRERVDRWLEGALEEVGGMELGLVSRRELMPLQQALALGEGAAMLPKKPLPAHLRDVIQLPGKTLGEGMGALAKQIETSLRDAAEIDGQMFYDDEPDDGFDDGSDG